MGGWVNGWMDEWVDEEECVRKAFRDKKQVNSNRNT